MFPDPGQAPVELKTISVTAEVLTSLVHVRNYNKVRNIIDVLEENLTNISNVRNTEYGKLSRNPQLLTVHHMSEDFEKIIGKNKITKIEAAHRCVLALRQVQPPCLHRD